MIERRKDMEEAARDQVILETTRFDKEDVEGAQASKTEKMQAQHLI
jgi:hypothetical protein